MSDPYAPPQADLTTDSLDDQTRRALLGTERNLRTLSSLFLISGSLLLLSNGFRLPVLLWVVIDGSAELLPMPLPTLLATTGFGLLMAIGSLWSGWKLRKHAPAARRPAALLCLPWLLVFPIGTLLSAVFLRSLLSEEGKRVLTPEHRDLIQRTPEVVVKTSAAAWVVLALLIVMLAGAVLLALL